MLCWPRSADICWGAICCALVRAAFTGIFSPSPDLRPVSRSLQATAAARGCGRTPRCAVSAMAAGNGGVRGCLVLTGHFRQPSIPSRWRFPGSGCRDRQGSGCGPCRAGSRGAAAALPAVMVLPGFELTSESIAQRGLSGPERRTGSWCPGYAGQPESLQRARSQSVHRAESITRLSLRGCCRRWRRWSPPRRTLLRWRW